MQRCIWDLTHWALGNAAVILNVHTHLTDWYHEYFLVNFSHVNSLAPGKFEWNFRSLIFKIISVTDGWGISCEIGLRWMPLDLTDDKSTLVQVMAWCRQATSHYLSQCWSSSMMLYGFSWPFVQHRNISKTTIKLLITVLRYEYYQLQNHQTVISLHQCIRDVNLLPMYRTCVFLH